MKSPGVLSFHPVGEAGLGSVAASIISWVTVLIRASNDLLQLALVGRNVTPTGVQYWPCSPTSFLQKSALIEAGMLCGGTNTLRIVLPLFNDGNCFKIQLARS